MMRFLTGNYLRICLALVLFAALFYFAGYLTINDNFYDRMLKNRADESYSGIVVGKYIDSAEHNTPKLKLSDTLISIENIFWDKVSVGDSIVKIKEEQFITLYSGHQNKETFSYSDYFRKLKESK